MHEANKIIFRRSDFKSDDEFFDELFRQIRILVEMDNVFSFHRNPEIKGVYALQFNPDYPTGEGIAYPIWLDGEEILYVTSFSRKRKVEEAKSIVKNFEEEDDDWELPVKDNVGGKHDA